MSEGSHILLAEAAAPRRARKEDAGVLARLFAAAFLTDPVFDWLTRPGVKRAGALERFFFCILNARAALQGDVWMSESASVAAIWLPPETTEYTGSIGEHLHQVLSFARLCGVPRLQRGFAFAEAIEKNRPKQRHFYLAFFAVAPRLQSLGLGGVFLDALLAQADRQSMPVYLENSLPGNTGFYEHHGFKRLRSIAPIGAPPMISMWRNPYGSNSESQ